MNNNQITFSSTSEAMLYIQEKTNIEDRSLAKEISYHAVDLFKTTEAVPGYRMHVARWVIKNEDIDLLNRFAPVAITGATAAADPTSHAARTAALATAVCTLVIIARNLRNFSIKLNPIEDKVLRSLAKLNGSAKTEAIAVDAALGDAEVKDALVSLSDIRTASGERRAVVEIDGDGRWCLLDV